MSELLELQLEVMPGKLKAVWRQESANLPEVKSRRSSGTASAVQEQGCSSVLSLEVPKWSAEQKKKVLLQLAEHPGELYELLQGSLTGGLAQLDLLPEESEILAEDRQDPGNSELPERLNVVKRRLAQEPLMAFALRGMAKEELLAGVFALWAEEESGPDGAALTGASGMLAAELARLERKGPAVSSGEWLAEAAAEGSLHQPGPLFHEITARPFPASPVVIAPPENWGTLLPQTPKAREGLTLIMQRVAESAARRAGRA